MVSYYEMYLKDNQYDACDTQYRKEILEFFELKKYDETKISIKTDKLYAELSKNLEFTRIFETVLYESNYKTFCPDAKVSSFCLVVLLSFDYFYLFKQCYKEFKEKENIDSSQLLIEKLLKNSDK
tara:strand:+ start:280 stop:654 length:375 start_codon:yes stop_codon:yes gene_type:complete